MTQVLKTYRTERGARGFIKTLKARWPHKLFRTAVAVGLDLRDYWYVEVFVDDVRGKPAWVGVGPLSRK